MRSADRYLTGASVLVSLTGLVTATSLSGGLSSALGASVSFNKLRQDLSAKVPDLNRQVAEALADALAPHRELPPQADVLIPQMIEFGALTPAEVMAVGRAAGGVCEAILGKLTDTEHRRGEMQSAFRTVVRPILERLLTDPKVSETLRPAFEAEVLATLSGLAGHVDRLVEEAGQRAKQLGVQEGLLLALARRYAEGTPDDFDSALRGLERALETATEMRRRISLSSNLGEAVDQVLARMQELNEVGRMEDATAALRKALAARKEKEAEEAAAVTALLQQGVRQAILERSVSDATGYVLELLEREGGLGSRFNHISAAFKEWYTRGRTEGLAFDLEVAIALAHEALGHAQNPDQRGGAYDDRGNALTILGQREGGTVRLKGAVADYRAALEEWTRERVPLQWAKAQNNLGAALAAVGERLNGTALLKEAITVYHNALEERTRERMPDEWATTQMNLGNALAALGWRENGTLGLEEAVGAYRSALEVWTREQASLDWAVTQMNLGNALATLGERKSDMARLEEAVRAYRSALEVWTRERAPVDWAATQMNLGNALATLGEHESDTAWLEEAVKAYRSALEVWTREQVPHDWAMTQMNLGAALAALGVLESDTAWLEEAVKAYRSALEEWTRDREPVNWAVTQNNLSAAYLHCAEQADQHEAAPLLENALAACLAALQVLTPEHVPQYHRLAEAHLQHIRSLLAALEARRRR